MENHLRSLASVLIAILLAGSLPCYANINIKYKHDQSTQTQIPDPLYKTLSKLSYNTCVRLTVAPVQLHPDKSGAAWIIHPAQNYVRLPSTPVDGTATSVGIALEQGMRIGIDTSGCYTGGLVRQSFYYTGKIELLGTGKTITLGSVHENGDTGPIPALKISKEIPLKIKLTTFKHKCKTGLNLHCSSGGEIVDKTVDQIQAYLRSLGEYCRVSYAKTAFDIEEKGGFRTTSITSVQVDGTPTSSIADRHFSALGWRLGSNNKPAEFGEINEDGLLVLYPNDFRDEHIANGLTEAQTTATIGTSARSGLVWPRIIGYEPAATQRGRSPASRTIRYWYACTLPRITRDVLAFCEDLPHTYFDMMFAKNEESKIGQDPDPEGTDVNNFGELGTHQSFYAWDINKPVGTPFFAARGGVVRYVEESNDCNSFDPGQNEETCPGNLIIVEHQDGTIANYLHLQKNGSLVSVNNRVKRGQALGFTGDTGNARGAHLHFGHEFPGFDWLGEDTDIAEPARFRLRKKQPNGSFSPMVCYAPVTGDVVKKY